MPARNPLAPFLEPLERLGLHYCVTGSVAASVYGEPRLTADIDVVLLMGQGHQGKGYARRLRPEMPAERVVVQLPVSDDGLRLACLCLSVILPLHSVGSNLRMLTSSYLRVTGGQPQTNFEFRGV